MDVIQEHDERMRVFHDIIGCAFDVYNEFRPGLTEYPYQYGLKHLLEKLGYTVVKEFDLPLYLYGELLDEKYRMDLVLVRPDEGHVIIECKAKKCIIDEHREQLRNYMLLTHNPYGILINFSKSGQVYSEAFQYDSDTHSVKPIDTRYLGWNTKETPRPWKDIPTEGFPDSQ